MLRVGMIGCGAVGAGVARAIARGRIVVTTLVGIADAFPRGLKIGGFRLTIIRHPARRGVRVVEGARLESVCRGNLTAGSNPALSATIPCHELHKPHEFKQMQDIP